jgi:hypothetical protein
VIQRKSPRWRHYNDAGRTSVVLENDALSANSPTERHHEATFSIQIDAD